MREKQFEQRVKGWLESQGIYRIGTDPARMPVRPCGYWVKRWGGGRYIPAGLPDMQVTVHGANLDVELKSETGRPAPLQTWMVKRIQEAGGMALILRPQEFEEFKALVRELKARERRSDAADELFSRWVL